jgi:hypothetical protein
MRIIAKPQGMFMTCTVVKDNGDYVTSGDHDYCCRFLDKRNHPEFDDLVVKRKKNGKTYKVIWEYIGEGWNGDFDKNDDEDMPLLRFSTFISGKEVDCGSYCTRCPIDTKKKILLRFSKEILNALELPSPKRRLEELSWLQPSDMPPKKTKQKS